MAAQDNRSPCSRRVRVRRHWIRSAALALGIALCVEAGWVGALGEYTMPWEVEVRSLSVYLLHAARACLIGIILFGLLLRFLRPRADGLTRCGRCGYILKGLSTPRCPECGKRI